MGSIGRGGPGWGVRVETWVGDIGRGMGWDMGSGRWVGVWVWIWVVGDESGYGLGYG